MEKGGKELDSNIVIALVSFAGTALGTIGGILTANKLTNYRISELEKKVEKHNTVVERTYAVERDIKLAFQMISEEKDAIEEIKDDIKHLKQH